MLEHSHLSNSTEITITSFSLGRLSKQPEEAMRFYDDLMDCTSSPRKRPELDLYSFRDV